MEKCSTGEAFCMNGCNCFLHSCPSPSLSSRSLGAVQTRLRNKLFGLELLIQSSWQQPQVIDNISRFELAVAAAEKVLHLISNRVGIISLVYMARDLGKLSSYSCTARRGKIWMGAKHRKVEVPPLNFFSSLVGCRHSHCQCLSVPPGRVKIPGTSQCQQRADNRGALLSKMSLENVMKKQIV